MSNTNDALVVIAALSGRYARAGRSVSRTLLTTYRELDAKHEKRDGPNAPQGAADAERFYRYAAAEADIDARRLTEFPELKPALDMPICKEWKDHARISEQEGFIPRVDTEGRAAALQAAERIRRRGGLLRRQEDGTLTGPHDMMNLSLDAMSRSQIYSIGARITERVVAVSLEPWVDPGHIRRAAEIHTDAAMAACGLTERWAQKRYDRLVCFKTTRLMAQTVDYKGVRSVHIYNILKLAGPSLESLRGGSENAGLIWRDLLNSRPHHDPVFSVRSPADIIRNLRGILDVDRRSWRALMRMDPEVLGALLAQEKVNGSHQQIIRAAAHWRSRCGVSRYKSVNKALDAIFAVGLESNTAKRTARDPARYESVIREYLRMAKMSTKERGCSFSCLNRHLRDILDHQARRIAALGPGRVAQPMRWHEYIASARAATNRRERPNAPEAGERRLCPMPALTESVRFGEYEAVEILRAEDITMPSYVTATLRTTLETPGRALLEVRRADGHPAVIITASDRSGHGKWRVEAVTRSHTGPKVPADTLIAISERIQAALRSGPLGRTRRRRQDR